MLCGTRRHVCVLMVCTHTKPYPTEWQAITTYFAASRLPSLLRFIASLRLDAAAVIAAQREISGR